MTPSSALIEEAERLLRNLAPELDGWSWSYDDETLFVGAAHKNGFGRRSICEVARTAGNREAAGRLIAAAPRLIRGLLDLITSQQQERKWSICERCDGEGFVFDGDGMEDNCEICGATGKVKQGSLARGQVGHRER